MTRVYIYTAIYVSVIKNKKSCVLYTESQKLKVSIFYLMTLNDKASCPLGSTHVHALYQQVHILNYMNLFTNHPFHEPPPPNAILVDHH